MSNTSANIPSFSRSDIQLLVSGYRRGGLHLWGQVGLFTQVLGLGPMNDKSTAVVAWELSELMGHVVCVVDPCSAAPWYLRIVLTPDFIFLGLHWAGSNSPVSLGDYYHSLVDAIRHRPLAMGAMACQQLDFDQEWLDLLRALDGHLGGKAGHLPPSMPTIPAAVPTMLANVTIVAAAAPTFAPPAVTMGDVQMVDAGVDAGGVGGGVGGSGVAQIVTRDGRVITPQWSASFPPLPGGPRR